MDIRVSIAGNRGDRAADLDSLHEWLRSEPDLAGRVAEDRSRPAPGEMGALSDALVVSVGSGGAVSALALSLRAWLSQPRGASIRVSIKGGKHQVVEITADNISRGKAENLIQRALDGWLDAE